MIAALLLYLGQATDADEAIRIYGTKRTIDGKVRDMDHSIDTDLLNMPLGNHYPKPNTICQLLWALVEGGSYRHVRSEQDNHTHHQFDDLQYTTSMES